LSQAVAAANQNVTNRRPMDTSAMLAVSNGNVRCDE
jgi:hypothetical protein